VRLDRRLLHGADVGDEAPDDVDGRWLVGQILNLLSPV
jgi:hypothetical protein